MWIRSTAHQSYCPSTILHIRPTATSDLQQIFSRLYYIERSEVELLICRSDGHSLVGRMGALFVGRMGAFFVGRMGTFRRSNGHSLQVGQALFEGRMGTFCMSDGHFLQVGWAFFVGRMGTQFKLFSTKVVRILYYWLPQ